MLLLGRVSPRGIFPQLTAPARFVSIVRPPANRIGNFVQDGRDRNPREPASRFQRNHVAHSPGFPDQSFSHTWPRNRGLLEYVDCSGELVFAAIFTGTRQSTAILDDRESQGDLSERE